MALLKKIAVTILVGAFIMAATKLLAPMRETSVSAPSDAQVVQVNLPADKVTIKFQSWHKDGFDTVAIQNLTIHNDNDYPVKDIKLDCRYYGNSGTLLTRHTPIVYELIPAKGKRTINNLNVGFIQSQANKGGCDVLSATRELK